MKKRFCRKIKAGICTVICVMALMMICACTGKKAGEEKEESTSFQTVEQTETSGTSETEGSRKDTEAQESSSGISFETEKAHEGGNQIGESGAAEGNSQSEKGGEKSEGAENGDKEEASYLPEHTLVYLKSDKDEKHYIAGGGFILQCKEDKLYICTNCHVIKDYDSFDVVFYDGTSVKGKKTGASDWYDVGFVEIELSELPEELKAEIYPVKINLDAWYLLQDNLSMDVWVRRTTKKGLSDEIVEGKMLHPLAEFKWGNGSAQSEFDMELQNGDSGLGIFNKDGYLVSMVYGTSHEDGKPRRWGVPLDAIIACYYTIVEGQQISGEGR